MVRRKGEACSRDRERASPLLYSNYSSNYSIGSDLVAGEVGDAVKALLQVGIGGDAVGHLAVAEQWVRANEKHPETYVSRCCFLVGAGGLREPRI